MSAMLDAYDMQMLDYSGDLDVQMHPSSSDAWFQDEAKMEEDGPPLIKHESVGHLKTDAYAHEKVDGNIEVDMEPTLDPHNAEYDMLDEEEFHAGEILDIEVYDASQVQSPAMFALDSEQGETFHRTFETLDLGSTLNVTVPAVPVGSLNPPLESSDTHTISGDEFSSASKVFVQPDIFESASEEQPVVGSSEPAAELVNPGIDPSPEFHAAKVHEPPVEGEEFSIQDSEGPETETIAVAAEFLEESHESEVDAPPMHLQSDNGPHDNAVPTNVHDAPESIVVPEDNASSGDPHEISEGVYIDPPPPVLLSMSSDDGFDFSLFNEPSTWNEGVQKEAEAKHSAHVLLHHLPTLYYEPLSTVFEALRQEEFIHSLFPTAETELMLEAVDLRLTLSEDNIYAREVTLHDLNVLHDVSGINGLLRMRLFTSTKPRFITRYQHLQDSVSQLDVGLSAEELLVNANADDALPHEEQHEQHEPSEPPKEYEAAQDQADERLLHDEEGQTLEEVEGDESYSEGQVQQHYEEQEQIFEPTSILQEQTEAFHANDETSSLHEQNTTETSSNRPLLTQDDSLSNHLLAEPKEKDDESETPTHHSTPTSGSRDIGESVHEEDAGVIALEAVEAHLHDVEYAEDVNPVNAEYKGEHELQYPVYDEEEEQETFTEEEYQEEDQGHQPQGEEYEEEGEGNEQQQNQQEHQEETQLDQIEGQHEIQGPGEVDQLPTDNPEQQISAGAPEPENESTYEQTTTVGEGINYSEGDHLEDVDAAFDGSALTEPTHELSRVEETERIPHDTADPPDPHPEIPAFVGEDWEDDLDGEGEIDDTWDENNEVETAQSNSNNSSITLSSKASKRSYDELDSDGNGDEDGDSHHWTPPSSPDPKRSRTH